jgi:hypothetical protein
MTRTASTTTLLTLLPRICPGCQDVVPLAVTCSGGTFYLGWICSRCLADDGEGVLDVVGVYATCEDAEWDLLGDEPDLGNHETPLAVVERTHEQSLESRGDGSP